jgi:hypothetical protein
MAAAVPVVLLPHLLGTALIIEILDDVNRFVVIGDDVLRK